MRLTIGDILTRNVCTIEPEDTLAHAARLMADKRISCIVATRDGKPAGILTEADLVRIGHLHVDMRQTAVESYLSQPVISIATDQSVYEAFDFLLEHHVRHLVVVDGDGRMQGLLTFSDILKATEFDDFLVTKPIADVMSRNVVTLKPSDGVEQALAMMDERHISCVVVVDEHGKASGIFSERDAARLLAGSDDPAGLSMRDVMSTPLITMHEDESLLEASQVMHRHRFRRMVIVDDADKPIGILTQFDVIHGLEGKRIQELKKSFAETEAALSEVQKLLAEKSEMERIVDISPVVLYRLEWREGEPLPKAYQDAPWAGNAGGCFVPSFVSAGVREVLGFEPDDCLRKDWWIEHVHPDDRPSVLENMGRLFRDGYLRHSYRLISAADEPVFVEDQLRLSRDEDGRPVEAVGSWMDITERKQAEAFEADQRKILEMIANSEVSLSEVLEEIVLTAQRQRPGMLGSVLLMDADGKHMRHGAAPDLPQAYSDAIDGGEIGPNAGSCGTAAFTGERVIVSDIATDPLWADYKDLALSHGLAACWSEPIISHGRVLGTFAMYYREPKAPDAGDIEIIERIAALAENAISQKQAEQAIRDSEEKYRSLFDDARDLIYITDADGVITDVNKALLERLGYKRDEMIGRNVFDFVHPDDVHGCAACFAATMQGSPKQGFEARFQTRSGEVVWVEVSASPQLDAAGEVVAVRAILHDVTERKAFEDALRDSESRYRNLVELMPDGIVLVENGCVVFANPEALRLYGYTEQEAIGQPILERIHPEDRSVAVARVQRLLVDKQGSNPLLEERMLRKDGSEFVAETASSYVEHQGRPAVLVVLRDVSERKAAEQALKESERRLQLIVSASPVPMVLTRKGDGKVLFANDELIRMFGGTDEQSAMQVLSPEVYVRLSEREAMIRQLESEGEFRGEIEFRRLSGETFWAIVSARIMEYGGEPVIIGLLMDMTEQRSLEEQFRHAQKMEAVGTMAGGIAHDFNNMLAGMLGQLFLLKKEIKDRPESVERIVKVERQGMRAAEIIQQMLTFARKSRTEMHAMPLAALLKETMKLHAVALPESISLQTSFEYPEIIINGDAAIIQQMVLNLLSNARDAVAETKGARIVMVLEPVSMQDEVYQRHAELQGKPLACLTVADNGCGIPDSLQSNIFDPFFTTKEVGKGTGLGLAMVYGAMQTHGGAVELQSEPGRGTEFRLYFSRLDEAVSMIEAESAEAVPGEDIGVLVADDEADLRDIMSEALGDIGYRVFTAADGEQAVALFAEHRDEIAVAILDVVMPKMGGHDACLKLRQIDPELPVLFHTGYGQDVLVDDIMNLPLIESITKPASIEQLTGKLAYLLHLRKI